MDRELFKESKQEEINTLEGLGCFHIVYKVQSEGLRLYRARFVDKIKNDGTKRSRLVVAAVRDDQHGLFTAATGLRRLSLRILLAIAVSFKFDLCAGDVTKAFAMSKTPLRRNVYMRAPVEFGLPKGKVLNVIKPLYGMPESPMHSYHTYSNQIIENVGMKATVMDPCLFVGHQAENVQVILGLQVDDTLFVRTAELLRHEEETSEEFPNKGRKSASDSLLMFNGVELSRDDDVIFMRQGEYIRECRKIGAREVLSFKEFRSIRAKLAYASFSTVPTLPVFVAKMAQFTGESFFKNT